LIVVIAVVAFFIAVVAASIIIVTAIDRLFFRSLDALDGLIKRRSAPPSSLFTSNEGRYKRGDSKTKINPSNSLVYPHKTHYEIDQQLIIAAHRNSPFKEIHAQRRYKNHHRNKNNRENLESPFGYFKHFVPIRHIRSIVNRLRGRVNESGKEPFSQDLTEGIVVKSQKSTCKDYYHPGLPETQKEAEPTHEKDECRSQVI
jgi:hypothetical protein